MTAGGLIVESSPEDPQEHYVWLIVNRESARQHARHPDIPERLQIPKGHMERGETERQTAAREIREELGFIAVAGERLGVFWRPAWEYRNGVRIEQVRKRIAVYAMERVPAPRLPETEEAVRRVRIDNQLLPRINHPKEADFLAQVFRRARLLD
jgi:8-oxo-dGTP pyrophosphatase MutT (NUDIX family)